MCTYWMNGHTSNSEQKEFETKFKLKFTCAPNEGSNQPVHPRSLNKVFAEQFVVAKDQKRLQTYSQGSDQPANLVGIAVSQPI